MRMLHPPSTSTHARPAHHPPSPQHPGNILVRLEEPVPAALAGGGGLAARLAALLPRLPRLVLLDVGMIARLTREDQQNLVGFFKVRACVTEHETKRNNENELVFLQPCGMRVRHGRRQAAARPAACSLQAPDQLPTRQPASALAHVLLAPRRAGPARAAPSRPTRSSSTSFLSPSLLAACCPHRPQGLTSMDGAELADSIMTFTEERPPNPGAFKADMAQLFASLDPELLRTNTPDVIAQVRRR